MSFAVKDSVVIYFHENQKFSWVNNNILKLIVNKVYNKETKKAIGNLSLNFSTPY